MSATTGEGDQIQALCVSCGLCCDGSLFDGLALRVEEAATMTRLGVPVVTYDADHFLRQPCTALVREKDASGQGELALCRVYEDRPKCCSSFHCRLLVAVEVGLVPIERARATIAMAKELGEPQRGQFLDFHFRVRTRQLGKLTPD